jgi:hypothetical protein
VTTLHARREFLKFAAAGLSTVALPRFAHAETATDLSPSYSAEVGHAVTEPAAIAVKARPIPAFDPGDKSRTRFGSLAWRSGLVLTSSYRGFGGLSGLRFLDTKGERFVAISDQGAWFTGTIRYDGQRMVALDDVAAAPLLNAEGRPITEQRGWYDSESIALDGSSAYVGLERVNQVMRFDVSKGFARARGEVVPTPAAVRTLPRNKGLEALVFVPKGLPLAGTLVALSERGLDADGNLMAFLVGGPSPGQFSVRRTDKFDVSDAVLLPSGELLILERKFSWFTGVNIRIRSIALKSIAPGALVDGVKLFEADLGHEIDNMEGIDAHVSPEGETVLTLISDDNFSPLQRTLLLQFTLVE